MQLLESVRNYIIYIIIYRVRNALVKLMPHPPPPTLLGDYTCEIVSLPIGDLQLDTGLIPMATRGLDQITRQQGIGIRSCDWSNPR